MRGVFCYVHLIQHIREYKIDYIDNGLDLIPSMSLILKRKSNICKSSFFKLDRCKHEWLCSVADWRRKNNDRLGIDAVDSATLVIVPTIDLMEQWTNKLSKVYKQTNIGNLGCGCDNLQFITDNI